MSKPNQKVLLGAGITVSVLSIIVLSLFVFHSVAKGKVLPNTSFLGLGLGLQPLNQVETQIQAHYDYITSSAVVSIVGEGDAQSYTYADLGFTFKPAPHASEYVQVYGENANFFDLLGSLFVPTLVPFTVASNEAHTELVIYEDFQEFKRSSNPYYQLRDNKLTEVDGYIGREFDWNFLYIHLIDSFNQLPGEDASITLLSVLVRPEISLNEIKSQEELVQNIIDRQYILQTASGSQKFTFTDETVLDLIRFAKTGGEIVPYVDSVLLSDLIDKELSELFSLSAGEVTITYNQETERASFSGDYSEGQEIDQAALKLLLETTFFDQEQSTEMEVPLQKLLGTIIIDEYLQKQGVTGIFAEGHTSFYGSPSNRIHNIGVGLERFNGRIVQPGEEFSFNTLLGRVDASTGYRPELVIKQEGTVPEYGGGLCQVSTTLYRAILNGDLDTTERRPHSYAVSYYAQQLGHGLDATIYPGVVDFKFTNTTEAPLVMQAYREGENAYFRLYGEANPISVEYDGPYITAYKQPGSPIYISDASLAPGAKVQVEKAHTGFDVTWYKTVTQEDGQEERKEIFSRYKAVPAKFRVGPEAANDEAVTSDEAINTTPNDLAFAN